jgi:hypothetical protein
MAIVLITERIGQFIPDSYDQEHQLFNYTDDVDLNKH